MSPDPAPAPIQATQRPALALHATAVVIGEAGVVIRGPSGAGKSALALALVEAARQAGVFARLVGDDRLLVRAAHGFLLASPHPAIAGRVERRGQGIATVDHENAVVVRCVIDLVEAGPPGSDTPPRMPSAEGTRTAIETVALPRLALLAGAAAPECARRALAFLREIAHAQGQG